MCHSNLKSLQQKFGEHVVDRMQAAGLRVFVPQRDLCAGTIEHASSAKIIEERCDKVVTIFSPSFFESSTNRFNTSFALYAGIKKNTNKLIPIMYKACELPTELNMYHKLSYKASTNHFFWDKLLVTTFGLKNVPDKLKECTFKLPNSDPASKQQLNGSNNNTDSVSTTVSSETSASTVTTVVSDTTALIARAPNPPNDDPNRAEDESCKQQKKKKGVRKMLKNLKSKLSNSTA